jgi:hypothetical protein
LILGILIILTAAIGALALDDLSGQFLQPRALYQGLIAA